MAGVKYYFLRETSQFAIKMILAFPFVDESSDDDDDDDNDGGDDSDVHSSSNESDESDVEDDNISDDEEDHTGNEVGSNKIDKKNQGPTPKKDRSILKTSSSNSKTEEKHNADCSICLIEFTDQLVGQPENCNHLFCLDCIKEWSKVLYGIFNNEM